MNHAPRGPARRSGGASAGRAARRPQPLPPVTLSELDGVRYLHLGSIWVQGAMRIRRPEAIELDYVQRMLAALLWGPADGWAGAQAVQLGLGAGALTRFTAGPLGMATTAVEINPQVVAVNQSHFRLPPGAEVVVGDAADWLAQAAPGQVRLLHVDLYDHEAAAPVLDDAAFYAACRDVLEPGAGVMAVNLFGRDASFAASLARIVAAFGAAHVTALRPTREGNTVVVAARDAALPPREALLERAAALETRFLALGLPARKWLRMLRPAGEAAAAAAAEGDGADAADPSASTEVPDGAPGRAACAGTPPRSRA